MVNQDRNTFAALLLALGEADTLISGVTRPYGQTIRQLRRVLDAKPGCTPLGIHILVGQTHPIFMADTPVTDRPTSEHPADIATHTAALTPRVGHEPRVAFLSYSTFGTPEHPGLANPPGAVRCRNARGAPFDYVAEQNTEHH